MGEHLHHEMHEHSLEVYRDEFDKLGKRAKVIAVCVAQSAGLTDRQVMERLNFWDMNQVRPRITELVKLRVLEEIGDTVDHKTGHRCRVVAVRKKPLAVPVQESLF
jgi:hypothetical protein